jgi:preprotein translocase subunit SecG
MYTLLLILIVLASILMVGIVLIQESKGGGLASNFASYNQIGGVRKTTDFVEKTTWALAAAMVVISVVCAYVAPRHGEQGPAVMNITNNQANPNNTQGVAAPAATTTPAPAAATDAAATTGEGAKE